MILVISNAFLIEGLSFLRADRVFFICSVFFALPFSLFNFSISFTNLPDIQLTNSSDEIAVSSRNLPALISELIYVFNKVV